VDEMIFDCEHVTDLLLQWQATKNPKLEADILQGSTKLIEAIVSTFDPTYRDDLIQESYARLLYACNYYSVNVGNLHSYFTSVIRNTCITYLQKQPRDTSIDDMIDEDQEPAEYTRAITVTDHRDSDDLLTELTERNRKRFPSVPISDIDAISEHIYYALKNSGSYPRELPKILSERMCIPIVLIRMICNSSIVWMRYTNISNAMLGHTEPSEFTLLKDLEDVVDANTYRTLRIVFSGMTLRII
jgi:RNA polymerase sigma factor (sigma-70 family)